MNLIKCDPGAHCALIGHVAAWSNWLVGKISVLEYVLKQSVHMLKSVLRLIDRIKQLIKKKRKQKPKKNKKKEKKKKPQQQWHTKHIRASVPGIHTTTLAVCVGVGCVCVCVCVLSFPSCCEASPHALFAVILLPHSHALSL